MCQYDTDAPAQGHPHPNAGILQKMKLKKRAITLILTGRFILNWTWPYFMNIYLCIKYDSNTPINLFKKNIGRKTFFEGEKGP